MDPIAVIAQLHADKVRLERRVIDLLHAANEHVERRRAMKTRAVALCQAMEDDNDVPEGAKTAAWNLKIGMMNL